MLEAWYKITNNVNTKILLRYITIRFRNVPFSWFSEKYFTLNRFTIWAIEVIYENKICTKLEIMVCCFKLIEIDKNDNEKILAQTVIACPFTNENTELTKAPAANNKDNLFFK